MIQRFFEIVLLFVLSSAAFSGELKLHHLKGVVGKAENVEVFLIQNDQDLSGNYFYKSKGRTIFLAGEFKQKGGNQFILTERTDDKHTGKFEGSILKGGLWKGKWFSAGKPVREFKFELKSLPEKEIDFGYKIAIKNLINERSPSCEARIDSFDVLENGTPVEAISKILDARISSGNYSTFCSAQPKGQCTKDILCAVETETRVFLAINNLISLEIATYAYSGGAHGTGVTHVLNYDLLRKKELALTDLIEPTKLGEFKKRFEKRLKAHLKEIDMEESEFGKFPQINEKTDFFMTPSSIFVFFDEDITTSHAIGPIQLEFTKSSLDSILKRDL